MADKFPSFIRKYVDEDSISGGFFARGNEFIDDLNEHLDHVDFQKLHDACLIDDEDSKNHEAFRDAIFENFKEYCERKAMELIPIINTKPKAKTITRHRRELKKLQKVATKFVEMLKRLHPAVKLQIESSGFDLQLSREIIEFEIFHEIPIPPKEMAELYKRYKPQYKDPASAIRIILLELIKVCEKARQELLRHAHAPTRYAETYFAHSLVRMFKNILDKLDDETFDIRSREEYFEQNKFDFVKKAFAELQIQQSDLMIKKHLNPSDNT